MDRSVQSPWERARDYLWRVAEQKKWPEAALVKGWEIIDREGERAKSASDFWKALRSAWTKEVPENPPESWIRLQKVWISASGEAATKEEAAWEQSWLGKLSGAVVASAQDAKEVGKKAGDLADKLAGAAPFLLLVVVGGAIAIKGKS